MEWRITWGVIFRPSREGTAAALRATRPDLAGDEADALELDEVMEPGLGLATGVRCEQLVGVGRGLEREPGEGEVAQVHYFFSLKCRIASGEGSGSGAGVSQWSCEEGRWRLTRVLA